MDELKVVVIDKDFEQMLISAERYALGRRTYVVKDTIDYIKRNIPHLSDWCLSILKADIKSEIDMCARLNNYSKMGMDTDIIEWINLHTVLEIETAKRTKDITCGRCPVALDADEYVACPFMSSSTVSIPMSKNKSCPMDVVAAQIKK